MSKAQIPTLAYLLHLGIFPAILRDVRVRQGNGVSENSDTIPVSGEVPFVSDGHYRLAIDSQAPFTKRLQGFVACSDLPKNGAGELRREFELFSYRGVESAGQPIRVQFLGIENPLRYPASGSEIADGHRVKMFGFADFNFDCANRFQYIRLSAILLNLSTHKAASKGGVST